MNITGIELPEYDLNKTYTYFYFCILITSIFYSFKTNSNLISNTNIQTFNLHIKRKCFLVFGQSVSQGNKMNKKLFNLVISDKVSNYNDIIIFAGDKPEKTDFIPKNIKCNELIFNNIIIFSYIYKGRLIFLLKDYHSKQTIHNVMECLWVSQILYNIGFTNIIEYYSVVFDNSQIIRLYHQFKNDQSDYFNIILEGIKNETIDKEEPLKQYINNWEKLIKEGCKGPKNVDKFLKETIIKRTSEINIVLSNNIYHSIMNTLVDVNKCFHIGCNKKAELDKILLNKKYGHWWNASSLVFLTKKEFNMDGGRTTSTSDIRN